MGDGPFCVFKLGDSLFCLFKSYRLGDDSPLQVSLLSRMLECLLDPFSLFLGPSQPLRGFGCEDHSTTLTPKHRIGVTYLVLNLERNHVVAVAASTVVSELSERHISGPRHDTVVDPPLARVDPCREGLSVGLKRFELVLRGLLFLYQFLAAGPHLGHGFLVGPFLLFVSILQPLDLVQEAQGLLFLTLESPPDHLQFGVHRRLLPHVPDRLHAFFEFG